MKTLKSLIVAIGFIPTLGFAQITIGEDGLYYQSKNQLYTGTYSEPIGSTGINNTYSIKEGLKDGESILYYENGNKKEVRSYLKGKMHGAWFTWNEKGVKTAEAYYTNDKKDRDWIVWDDNGVKRYEMFYKEGQKIGIWKMWDESGKLTMEKQY